MEAGVLLSAAAQLVGPHNGAMSLLLHAQANALYQEANIRNEQGGDFPAEECSSHTCSGCGDSCSSSKISPEITSEIEALVKDVEAILNNS